MTKTKEPEQPSNPPKPKNAVDRVFVDEIKALRSQTVMAQAEATQADAEANLKILKCVVALGGTPTIDSLCLQCGSLIHHGEQHVCGE